MQSCLAIGATLLALLLNVNGQIQVYTYEVSADSLVEGETLTIQIANTTVVSPDEMFNFISEFGGTATQGEDFTLDSTTITVSSSGRTMITLSGIDDGILEGNETIIISLANAIDIPPSMTTPDPVTITITDNNVGQARVVASDPAITEFSDAVMVEAMFCVDLIVVAGTEVDIEVEIEVTSDTAVLGEDYQVVTNTVTYEPTPNEPQCENVFNVLADGMPFESDEMITVTIVSASVGNESVSISSTQFETQYTITNPPVVDISLSINDGNEVEVDEESSTTISIEVVPSISSVDGLSAGLDSSIVVEISVVNSSAVLDSDYTLVENTTTSITFDSLAPATIEIEIVSDEVLEGDEMILVSVIPVLDETMPYTIRQMGDPVTITITDTIDASYIAFSLQPQMNPLLDESSEGRIDVNLTGFPRGGIDVINGLNIFFIYEGISADANDFTDATTMLTIPNCVSCSVSIVGTFSFNASLDTLLEGTEELMISVDESVQEFVGYSNITFPEPLIIGILDSNAVEANLQGESISQTINEVDMDALEVCVLLELNNDTLAVDLNITLQLSGCPGISSDYGIVDDVIMIANSINESSFRVCSNITSILDDDDFEELEMLNFSISSTSISNLPHSPESFAQFSIIDREDAVVELELVEFTAMELEQVDYTVMEGNCFSPILILNTPDTDGDGTHGSLSVPLSSGILLVNAMDGLGKSGLRIGTDITPNQVTYEFPINSTQDDTFNSSAEFCTVANNIYQGNRTFSLILTNPANNIQLGNATEATVLVIEADDVNPIVIILSVSATDVDEGQSITVCGNVVLAGSISNISTSFPISFMFLGQDGVASAENEDFPSDGISLDFSCFIEGATNCTAINTAEDQLLEGPEAFEINIEEDPNFLEALLFHNDIQVTINDQDSLEATINVTMTLINTEECGGTFIDVCLEVGGVTAIGNAFTAELVVDSATTAIIESDFQPGTVIPERCPNADSSDVSDSVLINFEVGSELTACGVVTILDDNIFEAEEMIVLTINETSVSDFATPSGSVTITIARDPQDATIFSSPSNNDTLTEGDTVSLCVIIESEGGALESPVEVFLTSNLDVEVVTDSGGFPVGTMPGTTGCFFVTITEDNILEGDDVVTLEVTSTDATVGENITINIQDDGDVRALNVTLDSPQVQGIEGGSVSVCASISGNITLEVPVIAELTVFRAEQAVNYDDYSITSLFTFTTSPSQDCVDIELLEDSSIEGCHSFSVSLVEPEEPAFSTSGITDILIEDTNDDFKLFFVNYRIEVNEGDQGVQVCLRLGGSDWLVLERPLILELSSDGVSSGDLSFGNVTFAMDSAINDIECAEVEVISDNLLESVEEFSIYVSNSSTLIDNFPTDSAISIGTVDATVDDIFLNLTLPCENPILVINTSDSDGVTVSLTAVDEVFTEGDDSFVPTEVVLSGLDGRVLGSILTVYIQITNMDNAEFFIESIEILPSLDTGSTNVTIINDEILNCPRVFVASIDRTDPPIAINSTTVPIQILDNEDLTIGLNDSEITVPEDAAHVEVCILVTDIPSGGIDLFCEIEVVLNFTGVSTSSDDIISELATVSIPSDATEGQVFCFTLQEIVFDDEVIEDTEYFLVSIQQTVPPLTVQSGSTMVFIEDSDVTKIGFEMKEYILVEGDTSSVCVTYNKVLEKSISVNYTLMNAMVAGNNEVPKTNVLVIGADASFDNPLEAGTFCFNITLDSDVYKEGLEIFTLRLTKEDDCVSLGRDLALAQVQANGAVEVSISSSSHLEVEESSGFVEICVQAQRQSQVVYEVTLSTMDDTALAGEDYVSVNKSLVFYPGLKLTQCVHIPVLNDECLEDDMEVFNVSISSNDDCVMIGGTSEVEVYIRDDDDILVSFSEGSIVVDESVNNITVCVLVCEGTLKRNAEISLDFYNGTAQSPADYSADMRTFTFTPDNFQDPYCFLIPILDDMIVEYTEDFRLMLTTVDVDVNFKIDEHTVEIVDNDCATIGFNQSSYVTSEDGVVDVCVDLQGQLERSVFAEVLIVQISSSAGDFNGTAVTIQFENEGVECVNIPITMDMILENDEQFVAVLRSQDSAVKFSQSSAVITIVDADSVVVGFSQLVYSVVEENETSTIEVCLVLEGESERSITVSLSTSDGSAIGGVDYEGITTAIDFVFGAQRKRRNAEIPYCINITIFANEIFENDENFFVGLSTVDEDVILSPQNATVIIVDQQTAIFALENEISEVCESDGTVMLCLILSDALAVDVEISVQVTDETTTGSDDYMFNPTTLTFGPSQPELSQCATIVLVNDDIPDGSVESFMYEFVSDNDRAILPQNGSITIVDDEPVEISFIQDTPTTDGFFVVEYDNLGSFTRATCTLPRRRTPEVDCLPETGSSTRDVSFTQSKRNVFEPIDITVTSDSCGITGSVSRSVIRVTRQRCTAIAINDGITVDENNMATAEWGSVGQNPMYLCLINGSDGVSCASPHTFSVVSGENTLTVRIDRAVSPGCPRDTDLVLTFIVP